jgi:hypothetical protein
LRLRRSVAAGSVLLEPKSSVKEPGRPEFFQNWIERARTTCRCTRSIVSRISSRVASAFRRKTFRLKPEATER